MDGRWARTETQVVRVEAASEFQVFDDRPKKHTADHQGDKQPLDAFLQKAATTSGSQRMERGPTGQREEQRHDPGLDKNPEDEHRQRDRAVTDMKEGPGAKDHSHVDGDHKIRGQNTKPIYVVTTTGGPRQCTDHGYGSLPVPLSPEVRQSLDDVIAPRSVVVEFPHAEDEECRCK